MSEIERGNACILPLPSMLHRLNSLFNGALRGPQTRSLWTRPILGIGPTETHMQRYLPYIPHERGTSPEPDFGISLNGKVPQIQSKVRAFSGPTTSGMEIANAVAAALAHSGRPMVHSPILAALYPGSPTMRIREQETAMGFLAADAEYRSLVDGPVLTSQELEDRICRAGVAYGGICSMLATVTGKVSPGTISACYTADNPPFIAFSSTIGEPKGSALKETLRRLRERKRKEVYSGDDAWVIARKGTDTFTVVFSLKALEKESPETGNPRYLDALDAPDVDVFRHIVRRARGYTEVCSNCAQMIVEMFGDKGPRIIDLSARHKIWAGRSTNSSRRRYAVPRT
ncbi:hypothetical protein DFH09DRAFT_1445169 [Mycena vulgaris]|nr:hypothetical protein DFH09DRAFT_1445169 [Mycena vulgaris]